MIWICKSNEYDFYIIIYYYYIIIILFYIIIKFFKYYYYIVICDLRFRFVNQIVCFLNCDLDLYFNFFLWFKFQTNFIQVNSNGGH